MNFARVVTLVAIFVVVTSAQRLPPPTEWLINISYRDTSCSNSAISTIKMWKSDICMDDNNQVKYTSNTSHVIENGCSFTTCSSCNPVAFYPINACSVVPDASRRSVAATTVATSAQWLSYMGTYDSLLSYLKGLGIDSTQNGAKFQRSCEQEPFGYTVTVKQCDADVDVGGYYFFGCNATHTYRQACTNSDCSACTAPTSSEETFPSCSEGQLRTAVCFDFRDAASPMAQPVASSVAPSASSAAPTSSTSSPQAAAPVAAAPAVAPSTQTGGPAPIATASPSGSRPAVASGATSFNQALALVVSATIAWVCATFM